MMEIISVAVGGALGAVCRYLLGNFISRASGSALPWGTFAINIIGCFCMGLLMTLIVERGMLPAAWRLFLCVGSVCLNPASCSSSTITKSKSVKGRKIAEREPMIMR